MTPRKANDQHQRRLERIRTTQPPPSLQEAVGQAKAYLADQVWLPPTELKATIQRLIDAVEPRATEPAEAAATVPVPVPVPEPAPPASIPPETASPAPDIAEPDAAEAETAPEKPSKPARKPRKTTRAKRPTHRGTVLGLQGRDDYEAELVLVSEGVWQDEAGRRFDAKDYGYDGEEAFRLDLDSVTAL
jgi:hypothetical protein